MFCSLTRPRPRARPGQRLAPVLAWLLALALGLLPAAAPAQAAGAPPGSPPAVPAAGGPAGPVAVPPLAPLRIVHVADTHWVGGGANTNTRKVLADVAKLDPRPQLLIHGGDVSELGAAGEYDGWLGALRGALGSLPARYVPGNHDGRWLDPGLALFNARFGGGHQSFDQAGVHFVLLNATIAAATHGNFDRPLLEWLQRDLAAAGREKPVLVFLHHPVAYAPLAFTDTDDEFLAALAPYNVRAIFTGHGHLHMNWQRNNIPLFMTQAASESGFKVLDMAGGTLRVLDGAVGQPLKPVAEIPLAAPAGPGRLEITGLARQADGKWQVSLRATGLPAGAGVWFRPGSGDWTAATPGPDGRFSGTFSMDGRAPGRHRLAAWAAPADAALPGKPMSGVQWENRDLGPSWSDYRDFETGGGPRVGWRYRATAGLQAAPDAGTRLVYVADRSGRLAALDGATGAERWYLSTGAPIAGSPALGGDRLGVANTAGLVLALDGATGKELWRFQAEAPVLAEPLWAAIQLIVGDAAGNLYGLDRSTGALRWKYQAGAAIRAKATYGAGAVFVGAWDRSVHAVDAFTGQPRWKATLPNGVYYSPANQPPLYFRGRVFVTRSQPSGGQGLFALDARDGRVLWSVPGSFGYSAPILHGGLVVAATGGGAVQAFDPMTGARQWSVATGVESFDGAISSFGSDVVLSGLRGTVVAVGAGAERWRFSTGPGYQFARPAPWAGNLLVGGMDGTLWALAASTGPAPPLTLGSPGESPAAPVDPGFPDLQGHPAAQWVGLGKLMGLATGFPDGGFHPEDSLTRGQQAALVARYLGLSAPSPSFVSRFADIKGHWSAPWVLALEERGVVAGVKAPDGRLLFEPDRRVTRAEVAQLQVRVLGRPQPSPGFTSRMADLAGHWAAPAVACLEELGLVSGHLQPDGKRTYGPDIPSTRADALTLLVRGAFGR